MSQRRVELTNLFRTRIAQWGLTEVQIAAAVKLAMEDNMAKSLSGTISKLSKGQLFVNTQVTSLHLFLYAKGFMTDLNVQERAILAILTPNTTCCCP